MDRLNHGFRWGIPLGLFVLGIFLFRRQEGPEEGGARHPFVTDSGHPPSESRRSPGEPPPGQTPRPAATRSAAPPPAMAEASSLRPLPPRELVKSRIRETVRRYCSAIAEGDQVALDLLRPSLQFERELALECAREELGRATDPVLATVIERTIAELNE